MDLDFALWEKLVLLALIVIVGAFFARDLGRKIRLIVKGHPDRPRTDRLATRVARVVKEVVFQSRVIGGRPVAGAMHAAVFGGFVFFAFETLDHFLRAFGLGYLHPLFGEYVWIFKGFLAIWAVLVSVGILGLAFRRFVMVKISPDPTSYSSGLVAAMIFLLMLTYLYTQAGPIHDQHAMAAKLNWWAHALLILGFPSLILRSKHFHLIMAPVAIFFRTERLGEMKPMDLDLEALEESDEEEEPKLGLEDLGTLSWKQRMDFLTCVECRRCTDHCPANLSQQELDPRGFVLDGRHSIEDLEDAEPVIGNVITEMALGQCTSCGACEAICPVGIEHLQVLMGAKQAQALALGTGVVAGDFLRDVERTGNALGKPKSERRKRIEELGIPYFEPGETEWLLWLGCIWSYDPDSRAAVEATVELLKRAGVSFGVLKQEHCSGHHSRRQGEEMQFQTLAGENLEAFKEAGVTKIIAPCPHCVHTLGREYPDLDGEFQPEIVHHTQMFERLIAEGRLRPVAGAFEGMASTYHDPCYLARYEHETAAPRSLLARAGVEFAEMERSGVRTMCCGGGAAGFARTDEYERRVDQERSDQVRATGAKMLVVSCPECKMMLNPAAEETKDIGEVLAEAVQRGE
jgi:Fe-S oxidoreductase